MRGSSSCESEPFVTLLAKVRCSITVEERSKSCAAPTGRVPGIRGAFIIASTPCSCVGAGGDWGGTNIAVVLDCSKSSRQCSLPSLLTYTHTPPTHHALPVPCRAYISVVVLLVQHPRSAGRHLQLRDGRGARSLGAAPRAWQGTRSPTLTRPNASARRAGGQRAAGAGGGPPA